MSIIIEPIPLSSWEVCYYDSLLDKLDICLLCKEGFCIITVWVHINLCFHLIIYLVLHLLLKFIQFCYKIPEKNYYNVTFS